ncbi:MAG: L-rhamnose mutarotase [Marinilabiliaceae bacterium]|nr:L-rhamnose mutarotase [Marinilabiliaceae bacterium]
MNTNQGYIAKTYPFPVKRFCRTMDLREDPELIAEYCKRHSKEEAWPEIRAGIREVGILEMEIYIMGSHLFMIVETPVDFDWDKAMAQLAQLPRQQEWETYMSIFQKCNPTDTANDKWTMMERIFYLYD